LAGIEKDTSGGKGANNLHNLHTTGTKNGLFAGKSWLWRHEQPACQPAYDKAALIEEVWGREAVIGPKLWEYVHRMWDHGLSYEDRVRLRVALGHHRAEHPGSPIETPQQLLFALLHDRVPA
jgi:hypothetical protein